MMVKKGEKVSSNQATNPAKQAKSNQTEVTMDKQTLKTKYPQVYEQAKAEGRREATSGDQDVKKQEQQRFVEAARALWGDESAQILQQGFDTGLSSEQLKKAKELFNKGGSTGQDGKANEILQGLLSAEGHQGLEPSQGSEDNPLLKNAKDRNGGEDNGDNPLLKNAQDRSGGEENGDS